MFALMRYASVHNTSRERQRLRTPHFIAISVNPAVWIIVPEVACLNGILSLPRRTGCESFLEVISWLVSGRDLISNSDPYMENSAAR